MPQTQTYKFMNESVDVASGIPVVGQSAVVDGPRSNSIPGEAVIGSRGTEVVTARNPFAAGSPITTAPGSGTTTSSSGSFAEAVVNLGNSINSAQTNVPATGFLTPNDVSLANEQKAASQARYEEQRTNLDKQREQAIRELEAQFGRAEQSLGQAHRNETGSSSLGLARMGGFDSASGQAVLTNLATTQRAEMQALMDKRDSAVNAAKNAYNEKQFAAAKALADEVKDIDKEIYDRAKDFANYTLQLRSQARQDAQFQLDTYKEQRQIEKDTFEKQKKAADFALDYGIKTPFYQIGKTIFRSDMMEPVSLAQYQEMTGQPVGATPDDTYFGGEYVTQPKKPLTANDTQLATAGGRVKLINRITGETIADLGSSRVAGSGGSTKKPSASVVNTYKLPSTVTADDYNFVSDTLKSLRTKKDFGKLTEAERYQLWGDTAEELKNLGYDVGDFDGLLWETFSPQGLDGFYKNRYPGYNLTGPNKPDTGNDNLEELQSQFAEALAKISEQQ